MPTYEAKVKKSFNYTVYVSSEGSQVAMLTYSKGFKDHGSITVDAKGDEADKVYSIERPDGLRGKTWKLCDNAGKGVCLLEKPSSLRRVVNVYANGEEWVFESSSRGSRKIVLEKKNGKEELTEVGSIEPLRKFHSKGICVLNDGSPSAPAHFMVLWMYYLWEKRNMEAGVASSAGAGASC